MAQRLLALDQSSRVSGYAIFYDGKLEDYGKFEFTDNDLGIRLLKIRQKVDGLIDKYNINEVVLEDIQLQNNVSNNVQTFKALAEVFGVVYELITEKDIKNSAVLSTVWKSALGVKGRTRPEQKRNAQAFVTSTYGIKATQDESDAICIGTYIIISQPAVFSWTK